MCCIIVQHVPSLLGFFGVWFVNSHSAIEGMGVLLHSVLICEYRCSKKCEIHKIEWISHFTFLGLLCPIFDNGLFLPNAS